MERRVEHLAEDDLLRRRSLARGLLGLAGSSRSGHGADDARAVESGRKSRLAARVEPLAYCVAAASHLTRCMLSYRDRNRATDPRRARRPLGCIPEPSAVVCSDCTASMSVDCHYFGCRTAERGQCALAQPLGVPFVSFCRRSRPRACAYAGHKLQHAFRCSSAARRLDARLHGLERISTAQPDRRARCPPVAAARSASVWLHSGQALGRLGRGCHARGLQRVQQREALLHPSQAC